MTPKLKAKELINKMLNQQSHTEELYDAKQCALVAVDEIQKAVLQYSQAVGYGIRSEDVFWQDVKKELESL